jgi:WD40 repeat protein
VKLTDFGIGQVVSAEALSGVTRAGFTQTLLGPSSSSQTGTQLYMAPELLAGKPATTRSDMYSLGVILYQLLVGDFARPVTTDWAQDVADPLLREDLQHCFAGRPEDRFPGAGQLASSLRNLARRTHERSEHLRTERRAEHRRKLMVAAGIALALLAVVSIALGYGLRAARRERDRARLEAYVADMKIADAALHANNLGQAMNLLRRHIPKPGDADLRGIEWRYLWKQCQGEQRSVFHHRSAVSSVALSDDGRWLATESGDQFWVWDTRALGQRRELARGAKGGMMEHLAFDPKGRFLATATTEAVLLWDPSSWRKLRSLPVTGAVLAFSGDGAKLATFGDEGIQVWNTATWEPEIPAGAFQPVFDRSRCVALNQDGSLLAVSSTAGWYSAAQQQHAVTVWRLPEGLVVLQDTRVSGVQKLALSDDGRWLAACLWGPPAMIHLWSVTEGHEVLRWVAHPGLGMALAFAAGGQELASAGSDQVISLWRTGTSNRVGLLKGHLSEVWSLRFAADGRLASGSKDGTARLWAPRDSAPKPSAFELPPGRLLGWVRAEAESFVAVNPANWTFEQWHLGTGQMVHQTQILGTNLLANLNGLLTPQNAPKSIRRSWAAIDEAVVARGEAGKIGWLFTGRPGWDLLATTGDGRLYAWSAETGELVYSNKLATEPFMVVRDARGKRVGIFENRPVGSMTALAAAKSDRSNRLGRSRISFWNLETNQREATITDHAPLVSSTMTALSPDYRLVAYPLTNGHVVVRETSAGRMVTDIEPMASGRYALTFSSDGRLLAVASDLGVAQIWAVATGQPVTGALVGHVAGIGKVDFSPDGKSVTTYCWDRSAKVWNVATGREVIADLPLNDLLFYHPFWKIFPDDGNSVMQSCGPNQISVLPLPTLAEIDAAEKARASVE